jgi:hypothetical protein
MRKCRAVKGRTMVKCRAGNRRIPFTKNHAAKYPLQTKAELAMDTVTLIAIYIVTTMIYQSIGFGISRAVDYQFPTAGLLVFLVLYLGAFYLAWPTAVRIFERLWGDRPLRGEDEAAAAARLDRHRARQPAAKQNA